MTAPAPPSSAGRFHREVWDGGAESVPVALLFAGWPIRSAIALRSSLNSSCVWSPVQPTSRAAWTRRNSRGTVTSSIKTGTRTLRRAASAASVLTQSDDTEAFDQRTTTQRASARDFSMTLSKVRPGAIVRSHHTDQPCDSSASTRSRVRGRSSVA